MAVLITGGAGYIGSHTAHRLVAEGVRVIAMDNLSSGFVDALPGGAEFVEGDIGDRELTAKTLRQFGCTDILHFAASSVV